MAATGLPLPASQQKTPSSSGPAGAQQPPQQNQQAQPGPGAPGASQPRTPQNTPAFAGSAPAGSNVVPFPAPQAPVVLDDPAEALKAMDEAFAKEAAAQQAAPVISELAAHVKSFWQTAHHARMTIENEMLEALLARRGEYTTAKMQQIQSQGQPAIYMMLASAKMRQVEALLRDTLIGAGTEKPWTISPTPDPELPPEEVAKIVQGVQMELEQALMMGLQPTMEEVRARMRLYKEQLITRLHEEAQIRAERMELKMEDQLVEGGWMDAMDSFISDISTFKTAFLKGPVVRKKPKLAWGDMGEMQVTEDLKLEWERVDPFDMYPAPWARSINEGPLIQRHRLNREELTQLIGVEGYSEASIRAVLAEYDQGLHNWLSIDSEKAMAEGKDQIAATAQTGLIDALQYWGTASGKMLLEWGLPAKEIKDSAKEYHIECWVIGQYVIKAVLNADPLARRPYYACSFQKVPGSVWGNAPYDLMKDCQDMCNATARALAGNLGIASGPQVWLNVDRIPSDEDVTAMFPWKVWQGTSDPMGGSSASKGIEFFQPQSNAQELIAVYEKFSMMADEYTGIPRYTTGLESGSAGRTASGLSMMLGNASKVIKQVVGSIDVSVIQPLLERLYYYNMRYGDDPDLKGDACIVARGALSLVTKEAAQVRTNEFLAATANPFDMQILGLEGRAEVLRNAAKRLDLNTDRVVPPVAVIKERAAMQMIAQAQAQAAMAAEGGPPGQPGQGGSGPSNSGQQLQNGAPVSDHNSPPKQ